MKDVISENNGEIYHPTLIMTEENEVVDWSCDCRFMSFEYWTKNNLNKVKTICRHILKVLAEAEKLPPEKWQTGRNLKIMITFINTPAFDKECQDLLQKVEKNYVSPNSEKKTLTMENGEQKQPIGKVEE